MPHALRWLMTIAAGVIAMLILSHWVSHESHLQSLRAALPVALPQPQMALTSEQLPDAVASLMLQQRIIRAGWEHARLSIDLLIDAQKQRPDAVWRDLAVLYRFAFARTDNVKQLLFRVFQETAHGRALLFYGDPQRADWPAERLERLRLLETETGEDEVIPDVMDLLVTPAGTKWLKKV